MIRFGLVCLFLEQPIRFRRKTAASLARAGRGEQLAALSELCLANARALLAALGYCRDHGIGDFRINSQLLPLVSHPEVGYRLADLPGRGEIEEAFEQCARFACAHGLRTTLHPDQFNLLSSPSERVTERTLAELCCQADLAERVGADVITLHGGGAYGDKRAALERLRRRIEALPEAIRRRLALENDDRIYTPADLLPVCADTGAPLVYDVHHHRCLPDGLSVAAATAAAVRTWDREPLFHLSSPLQGWAGRLPGPHHDYVDPADLPGCWLELGQPFTVEVEAKAKELAVLRLMADLEGR